MCFRVCCLLLMTNTKGCDAIEPDNIQAFEETNTGFPLTAADQLAYNSWLCAAVHNLPMAIGLKNDGGQVADLLACYDFAVVEECFEQSICPGTCLVSCLGSLTRVAKLFLPASTPPC